MPRGTGSIQLARIFGIRIGVSPSWFVVLFLFIFYLSSAFRDVLNGSDTQAYAIAVAAALLFFLSLILHELGHALAARRQGIGIAGIDLWFFGGIAKMSRDTDTPGEEFKVAAAGPAVTLAIVVACTVAGSLIDRPGHFLDTARFATNTTASASIVLLSWLATINAFLFVFNMVPGFPLDGGRIARAIAWKLFDDRTRATRFAGRSGQFFAYAFAGVGIFWMLSGDPWNGLWLLAISMFIGQAARGAIVQSDVEERLEGVTVADVMDPHPLTVDAEDTVIDIHNTLFEPQGWPWIAVTDASGRFLGVLQREAADAALTAGRPALKAREALEDDGTPYRIDIDQPLEALFGTDGLRRLGAVFAVDAEGILKGVVTVDQLRRALSPAR